MHASERAVEGRNAVTGRSAAGCLLARQPRTLAVLVLLGLAAACAAGGKDNAGAAAADGAAVASALPNAEIPQFSADTAFSYIAKQVSFGPRAPGMAGHEAQLRWMEEFLAKRADTLVVQSFSHRASDGKDLHLTNLFARFHPDAPDRVLLVTHWDTRPTADYEADSLKRKEPILGANDGGSGTAVLLEMANVLSRHSAPIGVDLLFVDGEDYTDDMYLGATYFAAHLPPGYKPLYGILVDMVGDQNPVYKIEANSQQLAPEVVERVWHTAEELGLGGIFSRSPGIAIEDDHLPLNRAGIRTIDIIDFDYGPGNAYWHTLQDDLAHTSPKGLGAVGRVLTTLIYRGG